MTLEESFCGEKTNQSINQQTDLDLERECLNGGITLQII